MARFLFKSVLLPAAIVAMVPAAHAEVWGFVDDKGVAHTADTQVDPRYKLFSRMPAKSAAIVRSALEEAAFELYTPQEAARLERHIAHPNVKRYESLIETSAKAHDIDPHLLRAMIAVESSFNPLAVSPKGAIGLMQVIPATGERFGLKSSAKRSVVQQLADPATSVRIGARYLDLLLERFSNDVALALAAYNAGEGTVERYGNTVPPYPETQGYVKLVQQLQALFRRGK